MKRDEVLQIVEEKLNDISKTVSPQHKPLFEKFCEIVRELVARLPESIDFSSQRSFTPTISYDPTERAIKFAEHCRRYAFTVSSSSGISVRVYVGRSNSPNKVKFQLQVLPFVKRKRVRVDLDDLPDII